MRIQLSPKRIVPDALTCWYEHGPDVDIVMDLKKLTFAPGSVEKLYAFHVLEHLMPAEILPTLSVWRSLMIPGGKVFIVDNDFEFICRSFLGGDLSIDQLNCDFSCPTNISKDNIVEYIKAAGFDQNKAAFWYADVAGEFPKEEFELVIALTV